MGESTETVNRPSAPAGDDAEFLRVPVNRPGCRLCGAPDVFWFAGDKCRHELATEDGDRGQHG